MMTVLRTSLGWILAALLLAPAAFAEEAAGDGVEVARDGAELQAELLARPDRDVVDTALVFTNHSSRLTRVVCRGFNANGAPVGAAHTAVPGNGLRFILASDLSGGLDFAGSARCRAGKGLRGSAFLLAPGAITDLPSGQRGGRISFPVVGTY